MKTTLLTDSQSSITKRLNIGARLGSSLAILSALLLVAQMPLRAVDVLTHLNDNNRSGANTSETILTPSNVNQTQFGKVWSYSVNGATYAEPLYASGVTINGVVHNVVYIVTMEDDVYAFDADSNTLLWSNTSFVGGNITPVPITDITGNNGLNIVGDVGIESTPYIDKSGGTIYVLARTKNTSTGLHAQTLHALDITTGAEKLGGPVVIPQDSGFSALMQNQRMGLAKAGNNIIITWTSHEDIQPYHGFMMAYNATTLARVAVFNDTPSGSQGGIWQQGRAPAVDASGNVYVITGNGTWDGSANFGESFLKLSSSLSRLDWFTPDNYNALNAADEDLGSGGAMLIPGTSLVIGGGKDRTLYVCNTGNLGHEQSGNGQVVQHISGFSSGEIHAGPVYWNSAANGQLIFDCGNGDHIKSFKFNGSTIGTSPFQTSSASAGGEPGGFLSISANGNGNGILWAVMETSDSDHGTVPGIVRAYNADNIGGTELWDSNQNSSRDSSGTFVKDANPMVANGRVYVGSYNGKVNVYGLLGGCTPTPITPYLQVNTGPWVQAANTNVAVGATLTLGPQPTNGGSWSWSGPSGFNSTSRQVTISTNMQTTQAGTYTATYTNTCGSASYQNFVITVGGGATNHNPISINFSGTGGTGTNMAASETAGVIPESNWNNFAGLSATSQPLVDSTGAGTTATLTFNDPKSFSATGIANTAGNNRMMKFYLDSSTNTTTTVTVSGLPADSNGYKVYVYFDGNNTETREGQYTISGTGITTTIINGFDNANVDFSGTFTQANNNAGNYVLFTIGNVSAFNLSATAVNNGAVYPRGPLNGIQIVPQ